MFAVKSNLLPDTRNKGVYFDPDEIIANYEKVSGKKLTKASAAIMRDFGEFINLAYQDGYRDGMEDNQ